MSRRKIGQLWQNRIAELAENENLSAEGIARKLENEWGQGKAKLEDRPPVGRTIQRYVREHKAKTKEHRDQYRYASWPESFLCNALPWEATRTFLDLLQHHHVTGGVRPPVRLAKWFWRVTLAMPDADIQKRAEIAGVIALKELARDFGDKTLRPYEWYLAYAPWRSKENRNMYRKAERANRIPGLPSEIVVTFR